MRDIRELKYLQSLPLEEKVLMTAQRIRGWYEYYNGNVAESFSGGKDSTVLKHITEQRALDICIKYGIDFKENGVCLYDILDRVSCWCCSNKNLKELRNYYLHLPEYWQRLKDYQSRTDRPFRRDGKTIFDLEERFANEVCNK